MENKMLYNVLIIYTIFMVMIGAIAAETVNRASNVNTTPINIIAVSSGRPLCDLLLLLQKQLEVSITYEDPYYEYKQCKEYLDGKWPLSSYRLVPDYLKGNYAKFQYDPNRNNEQILSDLIKEYNHTHDWVEYTYSVTGLSGTGFHVFPNKYRNAKGEFVNYKSPLNENISISFDSCNLWSAMRKIAKLLKEKDVCIEYGMGGRPPIAGLTTVQINLDIKELSIKNILDLFIARFNKERVNALLTWRLL